MEDLEQVELSDLAKAIRKSYAEHRRRIQPNYRVPSKLRPEWEKIATFLREHELDVTQFMSIQFASVRPFPHPNMLSGQRALDRFGNRAKTAELTEDRLREFRFEEDYFRTRSVIFSPEHVLRTSGTTLSPAYRYTKARALGLESVAREVEEQARLQLAAHPSCFRVYSQLLPEGELSKVLQTTAA